MSDLYGNLGSSIEKARTDKTGLYGDMGAVEEARAVTSFQGIPVQAWEYDLISKQIASAEERGDGDEKYRIASALQYSRLYGKPLSDTYQNLEAYNLAFLGEGYTPKTAPKAVADSLSIGWYTQRMNDLGNRIALSGGSDEALLSQYDELEKLTNGLADNVENRSLFVEALKAGAQSVPYMLQSGAVGALAVGAGAALTAATGGLSATAAAALFKFGSGLGSAVGTSGLEYMRMRKNGVDHDAAAALAALSAGAQGAIEVCLGADAAVAGLLTSGQLKTISGNVAKKVFVKGVWPTIAARAGLRLAGETFEEGVEEGLQSFTSSAADYIAAEIMETRGVKVDRDSLQKVLSDAMESAKMGALAAPVFGILSGPFEARADYQALRGMKEYAKATDRETFKQEAAENPAVKEILDTIPEEKQGEALDQVWQNAQAEVKKESEKAKPQAGKPEYLNGALYTAEQSLHERADGTVEAILKTGSPKTGERYGYLRYELQPTPEGGRQILLKGAGIKEEYASVGPELMVELAAKHPGIPIVTTEGSTERARSLVEQMGKVNPRGQEAGAQWFSGEENDVDSMAKARLRASLVEYIPNASSAQVEVGVLMHEMRANALGLGMSDYLQKHFQADLFSRDEAKLQDEWGKAKVAAEVEGAGARAGIAFDKDARAIIYVAKNANFKSFVHESSHAFRRQAAGTELGKRIDEAYGIVGGTWTRDREEAFTEDFLRWASYGEVRHEGLRGVFEQLGKWLVRLWNAVSSREQVKPEIAGIFNELFAAEKSPLAAIQAQGGAETASEVSTASPTPAEAQEGTLEPRAEAQEDFGEVPEVSPTTTLAPSEHPVAEIPVSEIVLSEDVPNFKEGANATTGAVEPLKAGHYERLGTAPIVVWERTNGKKEVITGRHRLDLARRTGETTIPAQVVREADGFTKEKAATFDAEANIRDGQGSVRDYANYFRNSDISREEASRRGLLSRDKGRAGFAIGRYAADGLYSLFRAGQIGEKKAAAIAEAAPNNDALQALGIKKARDLSAEELFNYVSLLAQSLTGSEASQADLFGSDDSLLVEAEKIAKEASAVLEGLVNEKRALEGAKRLGKADRLAILEKYGVKAGDEAAMQARIEELEGLIEEWENWTTDPGKIRELRKRLGMPVKEEAAAEESVSEDTETPMMFERDDLFGEDSISESAVRTFGLTLDPAEAGYILPDGRMLDFSGKNQLGKGTTAEVRGGTRRLGHESIAEVEGVSSRNPSIDFMKRTGAVRVDFERGAAYSIGVPTFDAAATVAAYAKGQFTLHIDGPDGELVGRKTLQNASAVAIAEFYDSPTKPETGSLFSEEELGPRVKDGQGLLFERELPAEAKDDLKVWQALNEIRRDEDMKRYAAKAVQAEAEGNPGFAAVMRRNIDKAREYVAEARAVADHLRGGNPLLVAREEWGGEVELKYGILHRSSREPGLYQFSMFDQRGPYTHIGPGTIAELVPEILGYGFKPSTTERMEFPDSSTGNTKAGTGMLFEDDARPGTLAVLHNIDSGLIARVEEFGGLPMPSLAVTRPDIDFLQFGDATLIADPQVARDAMAEGRLWDRDIWSPIVPSPEWKVNRKLLTAFDARWGKAGREVGDYAGIESLSASDYEGGAARFADKIENYSATRYLYLKEHGIVIEPIMRPKVPDSDLPIEAALEVKKYLDAHPGDGGDYVAEHVEAVKELLAAYAVQYVKERGLEDLDGLDDPSDRFSDHLAERWTEGNAPYALMRFAREYDPAAMVVNKGATFEALVEALKGREEDYRTWLYDQLAPIYSNPTIKVGRGKVPFNADSVVDWMLSRSDRASQDTMTFGPAKAAALAARPFRSREEVRGEEGRLVSTEASGAFYDDKIEPLTKRLQEALPPLYRYDNTWDALDSIYKAIGAYLKKGVAKPSSERMRSSLSAAGFSRVPGAVLADAVELAHLMADRPQDYYEAKPAKVLHLDDFKVAVIPATTPAASRAALAEAGVEVYEYKEGSDRAALVRKALSEHSYTLFESEGDYRYKSEDVLTAKLQGPMPGPQILKMLRGSGVKEEELHWTGLDAYLAEDAKRTPQEVKDYLEANKLKIRERTYGDNIEHRPGKYSTYRLSGGENYTELLFVLDKKGSYYRSSHWVEPNVLAHSRFDERTLNDGRRALFLEEIQSDWHQQGRRIGYRGNADTEGWTATPGEGDIASGPTWDVRDARGHFILGVPVENGMTAEMAIERAANSDRGPDGSKVFPAPLSKTWHEFVFRRMLREAAERGFDALAWTTGEQQAERYDLSKQINSIGYVKRGEDLYRLAVWGKNDENIYRNDSVSTSEMEDIVGKEMTQKIVNGEGRKEDFFTYLVDLDLKVGGEGMKGFYDKILVDYANKLGKRWGAAVKLEEFTREREDTHGNIVEDAYTVHSLPITPEMSRSVCEEGTMLFETVEEAANAVQDELYARDIEYSVRFSRSSLSRYYTFAIGERTYTVRVSDHPAPPQSSRWGYSSFSVNTKHPGELEAFREWINELAGEKKFAGKMLFEYVGENANLDEQERRARAPYSSEEIAYEDAVVLFEEEEDPKPIPSPEPDPFAENRGRFTEIMGKPGELEAFLKALWERMKGDYDPAAGEEKAPRPKSEVEKRLASHPFVLGAAITVGKNGQALAPSVRRAVLGTIRKNELAVKELAAEVLKNQDLAQEARLERESITGPAEIKNPRMRKYDEMTLAERTAILNRIRDEKIRAKIDSEGLSDRDIAEYIGRLEEDRQKLEQKEKALEHGKEKNEGLWEALHSARQEARMQTRMVAAEIRAMYRLRDMREKLITEILTPPPKGMRYEEKSKIRLIQEYLRAKKWEIERTEKGGYRKTGRIVEPAVLSMQFAHLFRETPELAQILTQNVVNKINDLPLSDWSVSDLAALNNAIDALLRQGIMAYAQKEAFRRKVEFEKRQEIANSFRRTAGYHAPMASGSDEERELVKKLDTHHLGSFTTINMDRFARYFMDKGNPDLPNWHLLVDEERDHYREKMGNVERRLGTLTNYIREKGIAPKDLYRKITVEKAGTGDSTATWTASDLMMFMLALRNEDSRKAVVFGNLFSEEERKTWPPDSLKAMASPRVNALMRAIQTELTQDEKGLAELIAADFNREFDRLNKAVISMTEEDLAKVDNYVPIKRIGEFFEQYSDEIVQDLFARNGISSRAGPKKGFTKRRTKIGPGNQTPIRLDLWGTFLDAVDKQEHLIAYGEYHRKLRNVYASRQSGEVTEALKHTLGKQGLDYLNRYIAEVANPVEYKDRDYSERLVRILRGNLSIGYLAFRWSSVANQLITSPLPYLAYAPGNLFGAAGQALANPRRFVEEVEAMSIILRQRQADPTYSQYKYLNREGWEGVVKAIGETGMKGLVLADRWSVAIGWKAVYDKAISQGLSDEEAVKQADDITLKCQPSARGVDLSPLFRDNNEWKRVVTQFGTQLNIIWQQFAFDMPNAVKERRFGEAVGILTAMGLAGMGLGALRKLRGKDDDEDDTWWNDWLFYALSQGTDSVPLIGSLITDEMKHLITGKKPYRDSDVFPVVGSILSAVDGIAEGKAKGVKDLAEAIGLVVGLPVQAVEDYLGWLIDQIMGE